MILLNNAGWNWKQSYKSSVCVCYPISLEEVSSPREHCLPFDRKRITPMFSSLFMIWSHHRDLSLSLSLSVCIYVYTMSVYILTPNMRYIYISQLFKYFIQVPELHYLVVLNYFYPLNIFRYHLLTFFACHLPQGTQWPAQMARIKYDFRN